MSQSPIDDFSERAMMRYRQGWKALNRLLHEDRSFSGHERNCVFLNTHSNTGNERFADISAASGLDFADDGRAVALSDWDFDGDLDIWVTNRTAPRIRFLRNNSARENHFISIKLHGDGKTTNRDAVGARVEVVLDGDNSLPLIKTLSAGDAFLSQSSSWLHFGLGNSKQIRHVVVHWPGDEQRQYDGLEVDHRYIIDQQSNSVNSWTPPTNRKQLKESQQETLASTSVARTVLPARRLLPSLRADGMEQPLNTMIDRPTVITIWSATCNTCAQELKDYADQADQIRQAGLNVLAVNLDNIEGDSSGAEQVLASTGFPFTNVSGTVELVRSLDVLKRAIFDRWQTSTVPASFLVDERGFVCVLYQGPVEISRLLTDVKLLNVPDSELRTYTSPFPGKWVMPPLAADPLPVTSHFIDEAMVNSGTDYLERHTQLGSQSPTNADGQEPGDLYYVLAVLLRDQEQIDESQEAFRRAIGYRPDDFRFRSDYASLLAKIGQLDQAAEQLQEAARINPSDVSTERKLAFIRMAQGNASAAIERFNKVVKAQPKDVACWYNLANAYRVNGQLDKAIQTYRHTVELQPGMTLAANNLAWILATHPQAENRNGTEAVKWADHVCKQTKYGSPAFLDTLACAYAETGDFKKATAAASKAIKILTTNGQSDQAASIQARLELFRKKMPYRDE
ncbi:MAG: tetratricopeptide repeat protein [Planctomycetales bacterium]|nr:tetratricopeptide repeat protein [Planctomycetales bacterium]